MVNVLKRSCTDLVCNSRGAFLVVAERSDRWTPELRARARALPPETRVVYHELSSSGHWVHVDNPEGLLALMREHLA